MKELYKYANEVGIKYSVDSLCKSVREQESEAKELVAKKLINTFGYPNNIVMCTYQSSSKIEFVNIKTNGTLASVETINDGTMFYIETKYYGDWFK